MTQQSKLEKFQTAIFQEIDEKAAHIRAEAERVKKEKIQENRRTRQLSIAVDLQRKTQEIRQKYQRELAKYSLDAKRSLLQKRQELTDQVFAGVSAKLEAFHASEEYPSYLTGKIAAFAAENPLPDVVIYLCPADFPLADAVKKAYIPGCEVRQDPAIRLGGFILRDEANSLYFDETFEQRLADQKDYFTLHSELFL
jgi:V/A-type H+-transporting ATPase subunit E